VSADSEFGDGKDQKKRKGKYDEWYGKKHTSYNISERKSRVKEEGKLEGSAQKTDNISKFLY